MSKRRILSLVLILLALLSASILFAIGCDGSRRYDCGANGCLEPMTQRDSDVDVDVDADEGRPPDADPEDAGRDGALDEEQRVLGDAELEESGEELPTTLCTTDGDCVLSLTFRLCCPCPQARHRSIVAWDECILEADGLAVRPTGCASGCDALSCEPCPQPTGATCFEAGCVATYPGECRTAADCAPGGICEIRDSLSRCIADPNECASDGDCPAEQRCRDWLGTGSLTCSRPDSCRVHDECDYNSFCEDPDGDGSYDCYDHTPACRPGREMSDCGPGYLCEDLDGDGYGECVELD